MAKQSIYFTPHYQKFTFVKVIVMILVAGLIITVMKFSTAPVLKSLGCESNDQACQNQKRIQTITSISLSFLIAIVVIVAIAVILNVVGVHTGSILAGAGIVGLIIGLGAQSIIKDVLNGMLIISENQVSVGDFISIANVRGEIIEGTVQSLSVRIMTLKAKDGSIVFVPSGNILHISNYSRDNQVVTVTAQIPTDTDLRTIIPVFTQLMAALNHDEKISEKLVTAPVLVGVDSSDISYISLEVQATVTPGNQWMVANYIRLQMLQSLQQLQIKSPQVFVNLRGSLNTSPTNPAGLDTSSENDSVQKESIQGPTNYTPSGALAGSNDRSKLEKSGFSLSGLTSTPSVGGVHRSIRRKRRFNPGNSYKMNQVLQF